ncbi:inositol monophosphatase family protein [Actinoplanes sp. NPDC051851]|uniref:inositol monophosphatase family protein n=1 Tax=Actinoplanes sp. NPDC051851 TaxID=3154753 RepID=UPI0034323A7E
MIIVNPLELTSRPDHEVAIVAALAGAAEVRARFGTAMSRVDKGGGDFATEGDIAAEQAVLAVLAAARPDDAVTGEEGGATGPADAARRWLVDPLCGTLNYGAQTRLVATNVALRSGSTVTAAASADPFTGETFWTDGHAARLRHEGVDTPLTPSAVTALVDVHLEHPDPTIPARLLATPAFYAHFRPRVLSTTLALLWVAAGRRAAFVTWGDQRDSVHFAAPLAVCRAAGCVITGIDGSPATAGSGGLIVTADTLTGARLAEVIASLTT